MQLYIFEKAMTKTVTLPYKENSETLNEFFVFLKCILVSFGLRDYKHPFLGSRTKSCFLRHRSILGLFPREHFSFKELSLEHIGILKESFEDFSQLVGFSPRESKSDASRDRCIGISFSLRFLSSHLKFSSFL